MVSYWSKTWCVDHRCSGRACKPQEKWIKVKERVKGDHQGQGACLTPCPLFVKHCRYHLSHWHFFFNYSFNTIGWGRQKNPVSINGQDDTGSKDNTERSSKVTFIECSECARFPQTHKNISMEHLSLFIFISSLLCSVFRDKADLMSN